MEKVIVLASHNKGKVKEFQKILGEFGYIVKSVSEFGYDAITYGNHEFDFGSKALADMYTVAAEKETSRPEFVNCNIDWSQNDAYFNRLCIPRRWNRTLYRI